MSIEIKLFTMKMITLFSVGLIEATPVLPSIPAQIFDVTRFGVKADSATDNGAAIQEVIDSAASAGGGIVLFPAASKPYLSRSFHFASRIDMRVEAGARLQIIDYKKYRLSGNSYPDWLTADNDSDIAISGGGIIDGNGADWWAAFNTNSSMPHRPFMINLNNCRRVHVHQITLKNSPMFHLVITANNVTIDSITISAPSIAPNTDGIDPAGQNYLITEDSISTGDDNIAIKPGNTACKNMLITNCHFGTGHGLSIGGQTDHGLDSLTVDNCTFTNTTNGLRLKANRTNGGLVRHLSYSNITMTNVDYPLYFTSYYSDTMDPFTDIAKPISATTPYWKDVTVQNLKAEGTGHSIVFEGTPEAPIDSVLLSGVSITAKTGFELAHVHHLQLQNDNYNGISIISKMISKQTDVTFTTVSLSSCNNNSILFTNVKNIKYLKKRSMNIAGRVLPASGHVSSGITISPSENKVIIINNK